MLIGVKETNILDFRLCEVLIYWVLEIKPRISIKCESIALDLDIGPVWRDDPDLTIPLHLDTASVDSQSRAEETWEK